MDVRAGLRFEGLGANLNAWHYKHQVLIIYIILRINI
jgi:hypothetical protein